jgi:hypothetical protein
MLKKILLISGLMSTVFGSTKAAVFTVPIRFSYTITMPPQPPLFDRKKGLVPTLLRHHGKIRATIVSNPKQLAHFNILVDTARQLSEAWEDKRFEAEIEPLMKIIKYLFLEYQKAKDEQKS